MLDQELAGAYFSSSLRSPFIRAQADDPAGCGVLRGRKKLTGSMFESTLKKWKKKKERECGVSSVKSNVKKCNQYIYII